MAKLTIMSKIIKTILLLSFIVIAFTLGIRTNAEDKERTENIEPVPVQEVKEVQKYSEVFSAKVTGYNTVPGQTDSTPCIAASGDNICGRDDVVACPRRIALGTKVEIEGKVYVCLDRLAKKYDYRIDISCDKDMKCPFKVTGTKQVKVLANN